MTCSASTCNKFGGTKNCVLHLNIPSAEPSVRHTPGVVCLHTLSDGTWRPVRTRARYLGLFASLLTRSSQAQRRRQCARGAGGCERHVTTMGPFYCPFDACRLWVTVELTPMEVPVSLWSEPTKPPSSVVQSDALLRFSRKSPRRQLLLSNTIFQPGRPRQRGVKLLAHGCLAGEQRLRFQPGRRSWLPALPTHLRAARASG